MTVPGAGTINVRVYRQPGCEDIPLPAYQSAHAAGMDVRAAVAEPMLVEPGNSAMVPTGLHIELPEGVEAQIRPRSGLAARNGVTILNSPGTIDADYRGEIRIIIINHGREPFTVKRGDRIAQMIVAPVLQVQWQQAPVLNDTARGHGGFGHTGA